MLTLLQSAEFATTIGSQRRWLAATDMLQIASGAFGLYRREIFLRTRGADPEYGEDLDLTIKARKMGYRVAFAPDAISETEMPDTLRGVFWQRLRWDRCYIRINLWKHGNLFDFRRFRWGDFIAGSLDLVFNLILLLLFPVYLVWVCLAIPQALLFILVVTYLFYTLAILIQLIVAYALCPREKRDWLWIAISPIYIFYASYLRLSRACGYLLEIFRSKRMSSGFFPPYVRKQIPDY